MMRKILAAAWCLLLPMVVLASARPEQDTLFVPAVPENALSYQNLVYKTRLDSIQKTVPLTYNEYVQKYIDIYASRKGQISKALGLADYYFPIFEKSLKAFNIPEEIKFLSIVESSLNPHAVSRVGATGPWQFMFTTAKAYGLTIDRFVDERKDPVSASQAAAAYFRDAYEELGDWLLAIAAYNCGKGAVSRAVAKAGGKADFWAIRHLLPLETRNYVPAFIATTYIMNCYRKHDIVPESPEFSLFTDVIQVNNPVSLAAIAKAANIDLKQLTLLNPSYKKQIVNGSASAPKRLVIPQRNDNISYASLYETLNGMEPGSATARIIEASDNGEQMSPTSLPASYKVKRGETLLTIANNFGIEVQDLKVWNQLKSTSIVPGQTLKLSPGTSKNTIVHPAKKYISYKVRPGDTLSEIAEKFNGGNISEIKSKNKLKTSVLQPGMVLRINKS